MMEEMGAAYMAHGHRHAGGQPHVHQHGRHRRRDRRSARSLRVRPEARVAMDAVEQVREALARVAKKGLAGECEALFSVRIPGQDAMAVGSAPGDVATIPFERAGEAAALHAGVYRLRGDAGAILTARQPWASRLADLPAPMPAVFDEQARRLGPRRRALFRRSAEDRSQRVSHRRRRPGHRVHGGASRPECRVAREVRQGLSARDAGRREDSLDPVARAVDRRPPFAQGPGARRRRPRPRRGAGRVFHILSGRQEAGAKASAGCADTVFFPLTW